MGMDLYVGTLTRYHSGQWENTAQQAAREMGAQYVALRPGDGGDEEAAEMEEVREVVTGWRDGVVASLNAAGHQVTAWNEDDSLPVFTERPGWGAITALVMLAARVDFPDTPWPDFLPDGWTNDEAYLQVVNSRPMPQSAAVVLPEMWLPLQYEGVFRAQNAAGREIDISSVFELKRQLDELEKLFGARLDSTPAPPQPEPEPQPEAPSGLFGKLFGRKPAPRVTPREETPFCVAARYSLDIWRDLADKACEHRLAMVVDY